MRDLIFPVGRQPEGALHVLDWQFQKLDASAQVGCGLSAGADRVRMILSERVLLVDNRPLQPAWQI